MNKVDQIKFYKHQLQISKELKQVALQNHNLASRIESEANSSLLMLGATGKAKKGRDQLSEEMKISLLGNLTK